MSLTRKPTRFRLLLLICMVLTVVLLASTGSSWIGTAAAQTIPSATPEGTLPPPTPVSTATPTPPPPPPASIWPWTICGGMGVLILTLLFFWLRRRREEEVEETLPPT